MASEDTAEKDMHHHRSFFKSLVVPKTTGKHAHRAGHWRRI